MRSLEPLDLDYVQDLIDVKGWPDVISWVSPEEINHEALRELWSLASDHYFELESIIVEIRKIFNE